MRTITLAIFFTITCCIAAAQSTVRDSLLHKLAIAKHDTNRVMVMVQICNFHRSRNIDSSRIYGEKALNLAKQINFPEGEIRASSSLGSTIWVIGDIPKALNLIFNGLQIARKYKLADEEIRCLNGIGVIYGRGLNDNVKALEYLYQAIPLIEGNKTSVANLTLENSIYLNIGVSYTQMNEYDSAQLYMQKPLIFLQSGSLMHTVSTMFMGQLQFLMGKRKQASEHLQNTFLLFSQHNQPRGLAEAYNIYAGFFENTNQPDSVIYYAKKALEHAKSISFKQQMLVSVNLLSKEYERTNIAEAYKYLKIAKTLNEELYGAEKVQSLQKLISEEQERQRRTELENIAYKNQVQRLWIFSISGAFLSALILSLILFRNNNKKQKANALLKRQKDKIQATQSQLIQSEKMASLGELTAGIAHEIQNPLNFVNNFSEVSKELLDELKDELATGNLQPATEISDDVIQNLDKIHHHGKRAEAIVKGMLQHSRANSGEKELIDINTLADEYLRLSYHGLRAKDKSFNADFKLQTDKNLPKINVVPQDIGRVLLNLINNAFYAVNKKVKSGIQEYKPVVIVRTTSSKSPSGDLGVEIRVQDNGPGIPTEIKDKIFQPFFTTKPTGQGTGLGLSLSYDIIKAHGGTLELKTEINEGSEFIIVLPNKMY